MKIRQKILVYFSILSITLVGISFVGIYTLFSNYRTQEFQQRIKDNTVTTLKFMAEVQQIDHELLQTMDRYTINNLYKEKLLIYDNDKKLIYASIDDTKIEYPEQLLSRLNPQNPLIEFEENSFDVVGVLFEFENQKYYGIAKAYDEFGLGKLAYLRNVLFFVFILIAAVILFSSFFLSKQISQPINRMAYELNDLNFNSQSSGTITVPSSGDEIEMLAKRFNELMKRLNDAFSFQKHAIHHISHELKTPIAKLVSNLEKLESGNDPELLKAGLKNQKEDTKNLGDIINTLLEISKVESGNKIDVGEVRVDELVFDVVEEIQILNETFSFEVQIGTNIHNEEDLRIVGNAKLIRLALVNLAANCIQYSDQPYATISISNSGTHLQIEFRNHGPVISDHEKQFIFQHFYRGENSKGKRGFGLGLVLTNKIVQLHRGTIQYLNAGGNENVFRISLPLR
jgi:signal transduction histidine kinase